MNFVWVNEKQQHPSWYAKHLHAMTAEKFGWGMHKRRFNWSQITYLVARPVKKEAYLLRIHLHDSVNNTRRESQLRFCGGGQTFDSLENTVASFVSTTDDTVGKGMTWGWEWVGQLLKALSLSHALTFSHSQRTPLCVIYQPLLHKWWQMLVD